MNEVIGVIPSRWGSTRFPGKSLAMIAGKPMIQWVCERVLQAKSLSRVVVATDDDRIADAVNSFNLSNVSVAMTRADHPSGTDRIAEAVINDPADVIINIQGDEPLIEPDLIDSLAQSMRADSSWDMATAATKIIDPTEINDPSIVKAVFNRNGQALYFSRATIPFVREPGSASPNYWRHIGIYAYRREYLLRLIKEPVCALEECEKLEQLRALDLGCKMKVIQTQDFGVGVDTPEDIYKAEVALKKLGLI